MVRTALYSLPFFGFTSVQIYIFLRNCDMNYVFYCAGVLCFFVYTFFKKSYSDIISSIEPFSISLTAFP